MLFLALFCLNLYASNALIPLIDKIDAGQAYCKETTPTNVQAYIKQTLPNSIGFCLGKESNQVQYQSDFKSLLKQAKEDPKKYAYYVGSAYSLGLGISPNVEESGDWLYKAEQAGSAQAQYAYPIMEMQGASKSCNLDVEKCTKHIEEKLVKLNTAKAYETLISISPNQAHRCEYADKAVNLGSSSAYPVYVYCQTEIDKKPLSKEMKDKLDSILNDKSSAIITKMVAAKLLGNNQAYDLLSQAVQ